jgi:LacI family transcriptional regulator
MVYRQNKQPLHEGGVIGYLTGDQSRGEWKSNSSLHQIFDGAKNRAEACGYRFEEFWIEEPGMNPLRWNKIFQARGIDALLLAPWICDPTALELDWTRFHSVKIGYSLIFPPTHTVENNHYQCMQLCIHHLRGKAYRRIGYANRILEEERLNHAYKAAFLVEQERCKRTEKIPPFTPKTWCRDLFTAWFNRYRPDVVISSDTEAHEWLLSMGLAIPADVAFANLDCHESNGRYSGVIQSHNEVGAAAVNVLISLVHRNERGLPPSPHLTLVEGRWTQGKSTR